MANKKITKTDKKAGANTRYAHNRSDQNGEPRQQNTSAPQDSGPSYDEDLFIQTNYRSKEEIAQAKQRSLQRKANALEKTMVAGTVHDDADTSELPAVGIFINESEVSAEVSTPKKRPDGRKTNSKQKGSFVESIPDLFTNRTKPRNYFANLFFTTSKFMIVCLLVVGFSGIGGVLGLAKAYVESLPTLDFSTITDTTVSSVVYDVNGKVLTNYYGDKNQDWAKIEDIPQYLKDAIVAVEDVRFYRHMGIDFKRLIGSFILNATSDSVQGGSTITQQVIKNTLLSTEQTYKRKIREAYLAIKLEETYSKDQILECYLNTIPMGGLIYGVKTAARDYFDKDLSELTLLECATLAGITNSPTRYNPRLNYYSRNNPEQTNTRTRNVLYEMYRFGFITQEEHDQALTEQLVVCEISPVATNYEMLAFIEYSIYDAITQLLKINNLPDTDENRSSMDTLIRENGYSIYTTIDPEKQKAAEDAVYSYANYPAMRYDSDKYTNDGKNPDGSYRTLIQPQAASVVVDYRNGYITAMVGGRQAPTGLKTYNRAYRSTMPVGSAIKPIAVYAPAIEAGLAPGTIFYDTRSPIRNWDTELGYPRNYNDKGYSGAMTMRTALTKSTNTVAAQMLMYYVGAENSYNTLVALGVDPAHINRDGPGLALGTSGVTPLEMAGAYSAIANMGVYIQPISFTKIVDKNGVTILDMLAKQERRQVFSQSTAYMMIDLLNYALTANKSKALLSGQTVGGKTGTTMESRGVFFAGFSGYYTCAVWIGSDAYKPLVSSSTGASHAAKLWHNIMSPLHEGLANRPIADLDADSLGIKKVKFCKYSGKLATDACPETVSDIGLYSDLITDVCTSHQKVVICTDTNCIATSSCVHTKEISVLTLPTKGQLLYMYNNHHDIYSQYWDEPTGNITICGLHTGDWSEDDQNKQALQAQAQALLERANTVMTTITLPDSQKIQLNELIFKLKEIHDNLANYTYDQYKQCYDDLLQFLDLVAPEEPPEPEG